MLNCRGPVYCLDPLSSGSYNSVATGNLGPYHPFGRDGSKIMRRMRWITCLWPGLPQLWTHGSWSGLIVAIGAAIVLDLLLLVSFGWSELVGSTLRSALWVAFGVFWVAAVAWSAKQLGGRTAPGNRDVNQDAFSEALDHYLRGDYYQTEHVLEGLVRENARDLDARLMLATLLRRVGRFDEAGRQLDTLTCYEGAEKWELEIQQERKLLETAKTNRATAA